MRALDDRKLVWVRLGVALGELERKLGMSAAVSIL